MTDNEMKIMASYISRMYLKDIEPSEIYNGLKCAHSDNLFDYIFTKYNLKYEKKKFFATLDKIYLEIKDKSINSESLDIEYTTKRFKNYCQKKENYIFEKLTYSLYLFTRNLYFDLIKDGASSVFFFSREGQFLKKIFDNFQKDIVGPTIKTHYLYVSRASTFLGSLQDIETESFNGLFHQYPNMSLKVFCQNLNFSDNEINNLKKSLHEDMEAEHNNLKDLESFKKLINNKYFIELYDKKRLEAKENFILYLKSFNSNIDDNIFIVDVGWKGTIQNNIQKIVPKVKILGYYLGLVNYEPIDLYSQKKAVLFENTLENKSQNGYLYNSNRSLFEILLGADHGSTLTYKKNNDKIIPVLNNLKKELELFKTKIAPIQDNMLNTFDEIARILKYSYYNNAIIEKNINKKYFKLLFSPTKDELDMYASFYHFENFGVMTYSTFKAKDKVNFKQKIKNYIHFKSFIQYDHTWQYLKLYQNNMRVGELILYWYKWIIFKKDKLI